jgi:hypothetical protein
MLKRYRHDKVPLNVLGSAAVKDISMDSAGLGNRVYSNKVVNSAIANGSTVEQETKNPIPGDSTANQ